jgi:glycosyltransferase involved in cell wall biosynthesis
VKVAHVMHGLMMGGLEQVVVRLCEAGRAHGVEPLVIAFGEDGAVSELLRDRGIALENLGRVRGMSPQAIAGIGWALRRHEVEVAHAHDVGPWLNAVAARALSPRTRAVVTLHQVFAPAGLDRGAAVAAAMVSDALVACGEEVRACVRGWMPGRTPVELIGNGVPLGAAPTAEDRAAARLRLGLPADARVFGYLGRLHPEKGSDLLVDAFVREFSGPKDQDTHLVLIGDGDLEPELRARVAQSGNPRVHFAGEILAAARLLPALDVYVQPSRREGRSLSMLEAMAAGLPTVAQALPAIRELHAHGETALLVDPARPELGKPMRQLLEDPALRTAMGERARAHAKRFSIDAMAEAYATLYRRVARRATRGAA